MKLEELPEDWREWVDGLTRGKKTTGDYILATLLSSKDLREFQKRAERTLINAKDEIDFDLEQVDAMEVLQEKCRQCINEKKVNEQCEHYVKRVMGECDGLMRVAVPEGG